MKRFLAMVLVICIFFSMQPAFAYAESTPEKEEKTKTRTIEEILDEYQLKSVKAQFSTENQHRKECRSIVPVYYIRQNSGTGNGRRTECCRL